MSAKNIYERFLWFDHKARAKRYPNTTALSKKFEISLKTAQRDIEFISLYACKSPVKGFNIEGENG